MATVNLGSIKFKWKGTYAGGTAYTIDDVVSYNGSSYICIQASTGNLPTDTAYFEQMSSAGTNGTDVGTTLTTQGDILYRDGSGLVRLGAGTSGQLLTTGGTGANPSWTTVDSGGLKQVVFATNTTKYTTTSTSFVASPPEITITPSSTSSKIVLQCEIATGTLGDGYPDFTIYRKIGSGSFSEVVTRPTNPNGGNSQGTWTTLRNNATTTMNEYEMNGVSDIFRDTPNTTSAVTYKWYVKTSNGGAVFINTSSHDYAGNVATYNMQGTSKMIAWEISV